MDQSSGWKIWLFPLSQPVEKREMTVMESGSHDDWTFYVLMNSKQSAVVEGQVEFSAWGFGFHLVLEDIFREKLDT